MTVIPFKAPTTGDPPIAAGQRPADRAVNQTPARTTTLTFPLILLAVVAVFPRLGFLAHPFESDAGLYVYMGKVVANGQVLYRDFYETKLPGVPLLTAGLYRILGDWWPGYVLLQIAMSVAGAVILSKAARRQFGPAAATPALLFGLVFLNFSPSVYRGFQLETVQTFFTCVAGYFAVRAMAADGQRRDAVLLGLFAGVAAMIKPTAGAVAVACVAALVGRAWKTRPHADPCGVGSFRTTRPLTLAILLTIAGATVAPLLVLAWTWRAGLLGEMPALWREISLYGSQSTFAADDWFKPLAVLIVGGFPFLIAWVFRRDAARGGVGHVGQGRPLNGVAFAVMWLVIECVGVVVQGRLYAYHLLPLAAPLTLLFAAACANGRRPVAILAAVAPVALVSVVANVPEYRSLWATGPRMLATSEYLRAHASPADSVAGDGIERLLIETKLRCGTRYAHLFYFANHDAAPTEFGQRFLDDLERNRPAWAVFRTDRAEHRLRQIAELPMYARRPVRRESFLEAWARIDAYVAANYDAVAKTEGKTVYRRKPTLHAGTEPRSP